MAIYDTLRQAILSGVLPAGERLGEVQLASLFKRSRTPVREAILRLESERLTERTPRRGFVVGRVSQAEVFEVYAMREVLDGLSARLAAHSILPMELENLKWLNGRLRAAAERQEYGQMLEINLEFHEATCRAARNSMLLRALRKMHDWVRRFPDTTFSYPGRALEAVNEHEALLDALARRDAASAERIAREHMTLAGQVRVAMLQDAR